MNNPPLMGFEWNQAEDFPDLGLISIVAFDLQDEPRAIGTGFIVNRRDDSADCVTAAHVFSEIRRIQSHPPRHSPSTPAEFLPPPRAIKIDMESVWAVSVESSRVEVCEITWMAMDDQTDIAFFSISLQDTSKSPFFTRTYTPNGKMPSAGELICIFSYAGMAVNVQLPKNKETMRLQLGRRHILRVGRILNYYPNGHRLCHGPCFETSIPVYSGMSGGPAFIYNAQSGPIRPFGIVCSDPDVDGENKENRSIAGSSILAALPCEKIIDQHKNEKIVLRILAQGLSGAVDEISSHR